MPGTILSFLLIVVLCVCGSRHERASSNSKLCMAWFVAFSPFCLASFGLTKVHRHACMFLFDQ